MRRVIRAQRGAGLVEILIATVILSIGLLASAKMQLQSLRTNQDSHFLGRAGTLLEDMVDRMRSNPDGIEGGFYDGADTRTAGVDRCLATACTPAELARADIARWHANLAPKNDGVLPDLPGLSDGTPAFGTIVAVADGTYTLTLTWSGDDVGEGTSRSLGTSFRP